MRWVGRIIRIDGLDTACPDVYLVLSCCIAGETKGVPRNGTRILSKPTSSDVTLNQKNSGAQETAHPGEQ